MLVLAKEVGRPVKWVDTREGLPRTTVHARGQVQHATIAGNRNGTITYAVLHRLIGTRVPYAGELHSVLAGNFRRHVTHTVTWRGQRNVKVVQSLLPVRSSRVTKPVGSLELDQDYRAVSIGTGDAHLQLALVLGLALLALRPMPGIGASPAPPCVDPNAHEAVPRVNEQLARHAGGAHTSCPG